MKKIALLIILSLVLVGCQKQDACLPPMLKVGDNCCLDENNNSLCDELEEKVLKSGSLQDDDFITLSQLEERINLSYFPIKRFNFTDVERDNITGIEATFDIRESSQFLILKMKKEYNFIKTEQNFSDFVKARHDLRTKNSKISANSWIDYQVIYADSNWKDTTYRYEHMLEPIKILDKDALLETSYLMYYDKITNFLKDNLELTYKINVWCTPELVVEVHPPDTWGFYYGFVSVGNLERLVNTELAKVKDDMIKDAENIAKICSGEILEGGLKPREVVFYGMDGFYPDEMKIKAGETVTVYNENDKGEGILLKFVRDRPRKVFISKTIPLGGKDEIQVEEPGTYTFFSDQYNGKVKLVVE